MREVLLLFLLGSCYAFGQLERKAELPFNWDRAGVQNWLEERDTVYFDSFGGKADGATKNDDALLELIRKIEEPTVIQFGSGKYLFSKTVRIKSNIVLAGSGAGKTELIFKGLSEDADCISTNGGRTTEFALVSQPIQIGAKSVITPVVKMWEVGDWVILVSEDKGLVHNDWAEKKTGQIVQIKQFNQVEISGTLTYEIVFESEIRRDYGWDNLPTLVKLEPSENCGIEDLSIRCLSPTIWHNANISFYYAVNSYARHISSDSCNYSHITFMYSANCEVTDSRFQYGLDYGNGGRAYGAVFQYAASECLVSRCEFKHLRHSILMQLGANGNCVDHCKSTDPYWTGVFLPKRSAGDIVLHGNYPYGNIFQYNEVQQIVIDNSHGINGPNNVFFHNKVHGYGIYMNRFPASDGQYFVGNEITNMKAFRGRYAIRGKNHTESMNRVKGKFKPKKR